MEFSVFKNNNALGGGLKRSSKMLTYRARLAHGRRRSVWRLKRQFKRPLVTYTCQLKVNRRWERYLRRLRFILKQTTMKPWKFMCTYNTLPYLTSEINHNYAYSESWSSRLHLIRQRLGSYVQTSWYRSIGNIQRLLRCQKPTKRLSET